MSTLSRDRAVVFLGDTNLRDSDPADLPLMTRWLEEANLMDLCDEVNCPTPGRIDRILYRSGNHIQLTGESWWVGEDFEDRDGVPLSDHEPIAGLFSWSVK